MGIDSTSSKWLQRNDIEEKMIHIFSLFILPFLLSTVEAKGFFVYLCIGEGCEGWQIALSIISILVFFLIICCSCWSSCKQCNRYIQAKDEEKNLRMKKPQVANTHPWASPTTTSPQTGPNPGVWPRPLGPSPSQYVCLPLTDVDLPETSQKDLSDLPPSYSTVV